MIAARGASRSATTERGSASIVTAAILVGIMTLALGAADLARVLLAASRASSQRLWRSTLKRDLPHQQQLFS